MRVLKGFRFRVHLSEQQMARAMQWIGAARFLWNLALEQRRMGLARSGPDKRYPSAFDQINELTELRAQLPWLQDVPRDASAQLLVELDKASQRCFQRLARPPRFKRRERDWLGICEPHPKAWRLDGDILRFPKLGNLRCIVHRPLEGKPKTCTLRREADGWYVSILCEIELPEPTPRTEPVVGIDRGVVNLVADSDGNLEPSPAFLERYLKRLSRAQQTVARRKKGSKNRAKAFRRVALLHQKIRRQREHVLHQLSSRYAKSHGTVVLEKLAVRNMTQSAAGTVNDPGVNVAAKTTLNRRILDSGWGRFGEMLAYKLAWAGGQLVHVPAAYSSQTCSESECGHIDPASRPSQAVFECTKCGHREHADVNAAKVIKSRWKPSAQTVEASGSSSGLRSRKVLRVPRRRPAQSPAL